MRKARSYVAYGQPYQRVGVPRGPRKLVATLARSLTEAQIHKVRAHAVEHSLRDLMRACDRALAGSVKARMAVARWVRSAE